MGRPNAALRKLIEVGPTERIEGETEMRSVSKMTTRKSIVQRLGKLSHREHGFLPWILPSGVIASGFHQESLLPLV